MSLKDNKVRRNVIGRIVSQVKVTDAVAAARFSVLHIRIVFIMPINIYLVNVNNLFVQLRTIKTAT